MNTYGYALQNPLTYVDPNGLVSFNARITALAARGDVRSLTNLVESGVLNTSQRKLAEQAIKKFSSTADDFIVQNCKGSINRKFPGQFKDKTLEQIFKAARQGDEGARTAKKLLTDNRFRK